MSDLHPPPPYEEAVLYSVNTPQQQNHNHSHRQQHLQPDNNDANLEKFKMGSVKLVQSTPTLVAPSAFSSPTSNSLVKHCSSSGVLNSTVTSPHPVPAVAEEITDINKAPAVINHSIILAPECEESDVFKRSYSLNNFPVKETAGHKAEHYSSDTSSRKDKDSRTGNFATANVENEVQKTLKREEKCNLADLDMTKDKTAVQEVCKHLDTKSMSPKRKSDYRNNKDLDMKSRLTGDIVRSCHARVDKSGTELEISSLDSTKKSSPPRSVSYSDLGRKPVFLEKQSTKLKNLDLISKGKSTPPSSHNHDVLESKPYFQYPAAKSSSIDESRRKSSATDRIRFDSFADVQNPMRQRSGTLDGAAPHSKQFSNTASGRDCLIQVLTPTSSKFSKSYSDLPREYRPDSHRKSYCEHAASKYPNFHGVCAGETRHLNAPVLYKQHNKSSSHINRAEEDSRIGKCHLLPEARDLQGARSKRSVSVDDVRMRSGTEDYVWKDGKVQLKNGGMTHGESVRYVWKDGHVEKITTDANNEDTQVEILETSDSKACSSINPVFVCVFLVGVIAVVIILPVYFAS